MHDMPPSGCVKPIHIHFHLNNGDILAVRELNAPPHGKIPFLSPGKLIQTCLVFLLRWPCDLLNPTWSAILAFDLAIPPNAPTPQKHATQIFASTST